MKIYLSHASDIDYQKLIYEPIKASALVEKNDFFFPHEHNLMKTKDIIASSDLLIAECSISSTGQGIELGWANDLNIPIVCFYQKDNMISSSLNLITKDIISYDNTVDMIEKLENFIKMIK